MNTEEFCPPPLDLRNQDINLAQLLHCPSDRLVLGKDRRLQIGGVHAAAPDIGAGSRGTLYKGVECLGGLPVLQGINRLKLERTFLSNWVQFKRRGSVCN